MKEPQRVKKIERHLQPQENPYQPPECRQQSKSPTDGLENHVERGEKHDHACAVNEVAGDADPKKLFVRQDIPRGFGTVMDDQAGMDTKIDVDHHRESDEVSESRDFGGFAL